MNFLQRFGLNKKAARQEPFVEPLALDDATPIETLDEISALTELPKFEKVLSLPDGEVALGSGQRSALALLKINRDAAIILAVRKEVNQNSFLTLEQKAKKKFKSVTTLIVKRSVLVELYNNAADGKQFNVQKIEGENAQSSTLFYEMMERGVDNRASDLLVEISEEDNVATLRYMLDGEYYPLDHIRPATSAIDAVMYGYTKLAEESSRSEPAFNKRLQQSCNIPLTIRGVEYTLRWQSTYKVGGLVVAFRFLATAADSEILTLEALGFERSQCDSILLMISSKGAVVIVGDTGSGKSTTLRTAQSVIPDRDRKHVIFVEDPVEYRKYQTTEISVQRTADSTVNPFTAAMRVAMRLNPNVIVPGEIRDAEVAGIFEFAVDSGHKALTTTHSGPGVAVIRKLTSDQIGMSRQVLTSRNFLAGIVYQHLVAKLCTACRLPARGRLNPKTAHLLESKFKLSLDTMYVRNPCGCDECGKKGTAGRTVLSEVTPMEPRLQLLLRAGKDAEAEDYYRSLRRTTFDDPDMTGKTVFEHGLYKVHCGIVDPEMMSRALDEPFETYPVLPLMTELDEQAVSIFKHSEAA